MQQRSKGRNKTGRKRPPQFRRQRGRQTSTANEQLLSILKPSEEDVMKLLAAQVHIGRRKAHVNMKRYIWKRREDGIHVINLEKTWAKLVLAARILVTVREPSDICVMSTRTYGQRGAIKFAHYTGATASVGKWVPGTFTNPQNKAFFEPRILIVDDPSTCFAALRETSYVGIPVISLCGTDNNSRFVDCCIPCNNRGKFSIGLMFWLLARELLRMRGDPSCIRTVEWKESVDLFFYRDADEIKRQQDAKLAKLQRAKMAQQQQQMQAEVDQQPLEYGDQAPDQYDEYYDEHGQIIQGQAAEQGAEQGQEYYEDGDDAYQQQANAQNWDMPATGIEDWDNDNQGVQVQDEQQEPMQEQQQQQQQQQGQGQGQGQVEEYEEPNQEAGGGGMGMQNW